MTNLLDDFRKAMRVEDEEMVHLHYESVVWYHIAAKSDHDNEKMYWEVTLKANTNELFYLVHPDNDSRRFVSLSEAKSCLYLFLSEDTLSKIREDFHTQADHIAGMVRLAKSLGIFGQGDEDSEEEEGFRGPHASDPYEVDGHAEPNS